MQINYMLTIGDKEAENKTVALRTRDNVVHGEVQLSHLIDLLTRENKDRSLVSYFAKEGQHEHNCCQ